MSSAQTERGLRLLSIGDGGLRILAALYTLREILYRLKSAQSLVELPRPCDVFDLAGGTGLGGIIVLMLFRLQMSIEGTIATYVQFARRTFSKKKRAFQVAKFKASLFEEAFLDIIQHLLSIESEEARNVLMLNDEGPKCFVCATPGRQMTLPALFRSWTSPNPTFNCTIIEAARATTASPTSFKSVEIGEPHFKETYFGGSPSCTNPVKFVLEEARTTFPSRPISCVLSLGPISMDIVDLEQSPQLRDLFFHFEVDHGPQMPSLTEWEQLPLVMTHTMQHLLKVEVSERLDRLVVSVNGEGAPCKPPPTDLTSSDHQALEKLKELVVVGAYEPSGELPEFIPGSYNSEIATTMEWIEADDRTRPFCVVFGPAGSGKTSLLSYIARTCKEKGYGTARFFFEYRKRKSAEHLVTTIAFQIALSIPELQPYVAKAIRLDSTTLSASLRTRIDHLLVQPMQQLRSDYPSFIVRSQVILIDALDECDTPDILFQLISTLSSALSSNPLPYFCVFSSRPEADIVKAFSSGPTQYLIFRQMSLDLGSMADVRNYLRSSMQKIRDGHPSRELIPANWPSESDLELLARKSEGLFIYAVTAMKYVDSPDHNPHDRLRSLLGFSPATPDYSSELDALYRTLLSSVVDTSAMREILGIYLLLLTSQSWIPETLKYEHSDFFKRHFDSLGADTVLAPLAPILRCENSTFTLYHYSFVDFLFDLERSREFFVNRTSWQQWVVGRLVQHFYEGNSIKSEDFEYLIKEKPVALRQAIITGCTLATSNGFDVWPFVTYMFFSQLGLIVAPVQEYVNQNTFIQPRDDLVPLSVLMKLGPDNLSNSFFLFEFCRMCAAMKNLRLIKESGTYITPTRLSDCMAYLADFLDDWQGEVNTFLQSDYIAATLRCLWYLRTPSCDIRSSLKQQLSSLLLIPQDMGITKYLDIDTSNLSRGALQALPKLLRLITSGRPDDNLVRALKEPFNNEVTSMTPTLSRQAQNTIHSYIQSRARSQDADVHPGEDKSESEFHAFLISKERLEPLWLSIENEYK